MSGASSLAISLTLSVFLISASIGMLLYAYLMPDSSMRLFLSALSLSLLAAVGFNIAYVIRIEQEKREQHKQKARVDPRYCPDYWRNRFDRCSGNSCTPVFEEGDGTHVIMSQDHAQTVGTPLSNLRTANGRGLCQSRDDRQFPWIEVDIACDAKDRLS